MVPNATNHAVAACDSQLTKRDDRNSRAFDCSQAQYDNSSNDTDEVVG